MLLSRPLLVGVPEVLLGGNKWWPMRRRVSVDTGLSYVGPLLSPSEVRLASSKLHDAVSISHRYSWLRFEMMRMVERRPYSNYTMPTLEDTITI